MNLVCCPKEIVFWKEAIVYQHEFVKVNCQLELG